MATNKTVSIVLAATEFAAAAHIDQRRKDASEAPYINHPIALARLLANEGNVIDAVTLAAAILHDVVEDTGITLDQLKAIFGDDVASVVAEVSDDKSLPKKQRKLLQIEHAKNASKRARLVKLADKICNLRDMLISQPQGWEPSRVSEYFYFASDVVDQIRGTHKQLEAIFDDVILRANERGMILPRDVDKLLTPE